MSLRLRIEHGQDAGKTWRLPRPGVYTLGRGTDSSIRVLDMKVSKLHCEIQISAGGAIFKDLASTHGCLLNAQQVKGTKQLNPGDELRLGMTILRVLSDGEADAEAKPAAGRTASAEDASAGRSSAPATKQTLAADALVGKALGGYQVESKIGAGGMGGVYLAEQTSLKRKVALKVLNEKFAADSAFVDQFVNEARAAGALNHPNVVQVYDVGSADGNYFFSMEVMPGGSIEDKIREGAVEWQDGLNWFIDAANALIFADKREILHRDVKPDNLMIGEDESAKLCDLGLAKKSEVKDLMDQGIIGTPHFISPEAIRRKQDIDVRTDLYSLGCSFYRVFTGQNPYPGKSVKEILLGHLNKPVPTINSVNRNVPKELDEIVTQLMAKDPADRFQTPGDLLKALDKVRAHYNLEAHGIKPASRKPLIIGAAAAVIAIGVAVFFAMKPDTVVVQDKTPEQIAQELKVKRDAVKQRLNGRVLNANGMLVALNGRAVELGGVTKDNFKDARWVKLIGEYGSAADDWDKALETWGEEQAKEKDGEVQGYYRDYTGQLAGLVTKARSKAKEFDDDVKELKQDEVQITAATKKAKEDFEAAVKKLAGEIQTQFEDRQFIACETKLQAAVLQKLSNDFLKLKYKKYALLDYKKDIIPVLDKYVPGDAKGLNRGKKTVDAAVKAIDNKTKSQIDAAQARVQKSEPKISDFDGAIAQLETYVKEFPATTPADAKGAPRTTAAFRRARSAKVEPAIKALERARQLLIWERDAADREAYFKLVKKLWAPAAADGLLNRFSLQAAVDQAQLVADVMKTPGYKRLAQEWVVTTKALKALFDRFHKSFGDGTWESTSFYKNDAKGRRKKTTIKSVGPEGISWKKGEIHSYTEIGPAQLLAEFFFTRTKDGSATGPRFKCVAADHFGLGVLFELAGDYDNAAKQYRSAESGLGSDPQVEVIRARVDRIPAEREAAAKWMAPQAWIHKNRAYVEQLEALRDAGKFDKEARAGLFNQKEELLKQLQNMQTMRYELLEDARLAGTAWGSCVREAPHPGVAYAGEQLPRKAAGSPGNGRDPGPSNGGGKKNPRDGKQPGGGKKPGGGKRPGGEPRKPGAGGKGSDKGAPPPKDDEKKKKPQDGKIRGK